MTDLELLKQYAEARSQEAFAELVRRHLQWVYGAANRLVHDRELAEDVTQGVFLALSQRARSLQREQSISPWLLRVTRCAAVSALRAVSRRQRHEQKAAAMRPETTTRDPEAQWQEVAPLLDEQVLRLGKKDQEAILLRFYEQRPLAEVGKALGISEEAARMRVQRAVEKLRVILEKKGISGTTTGLSAALVGNVVGKMPEGLVAKVMSAVGSGGGSTVAVGIAKGAMKMMAYAKVKVAAVLLFAMLGVGIWAGAAGSGTQPASKLAVAAGALPATIPTGELQVPTLSELLARLDHAAKQMKRLHVRGTSRRYVMAEGDDQWRATPVKVEGEAWFEFQPILRFRRDTSLEITSWVGGAAPYFAERSCRTWDGRQGLYRITGSVPYDGVTLQPMQERREDRRIDTTDRGFPRRVVGGPEVGLEFAVASNVDSYCLEGIRLLASDDPRAAGAPIKISLVKVDGEQQVYLQITGWSGTQDDFWFSPDHGWMPCRYAWRRTAAEKPKREWEVHEFTASEGTWYPSRASLTQWNYRGSDGKVESVRTIYEADLVEVNPKAFDEAMFRQ